MNTNAITQGQIDAMYAFYREGHSTRQTAHKFKVSCSTVSRCFRRCGYPVRSQVHAMILRQQTRELALTMYHEWQSGVSTRVIAEKYHYTRSSVMKKIRPFKKSNRVAA